MNLIPSQACENGNYLCTWGLQERAARSLNIAGANIPARQRNALTSALLFDREDLYHPYPREDRAGLYFLLDDGWDVPFDTDAQQGIRPFGSLIADESKFPGMGSTPTQRLCAIARRVEQLGYAGLGLWISPQISGGEDPLDWDAARAYWEERARWCHEAGVKYWKVDWGRDSETPGYRELMTRCVRGYAPGLLIEHAVLQGPFHGTAGPGDALALQMQQRFAHSDFFRTYDIAEPFSNAETFCRANVLLQAVRQSDMQQGCRGCINVESQPMVAAGLGLHLGVMKMNRETQACLRWQRLAPPMSAFDCAYHASAQQVTDRLLFDHDPAWWVRGRVGTEFSITVPAIAARGTALPQVQCSGEPPIVLASENAVTGAYAVSILRRCIDPNAGIALLADLTITPSSLHAPIAVFGMCRSLEVRFPQPLPAGSTVWAQCLVSGDAADVTAQVTLLENGVRIDGRLLRLWGHDMTESFAVHEPAVVLAVR